MKKKPINNVMIALIDVLLGLSIMFFIAAVFHKCTDRELEPQTAEMLSTHSDKGFTTDENGLLIIDKD